MQTRREMIRTTTMLAGGIAAGGLLVPSALGAAGPAAALRPARRSANGKLQLLQVGVGGSIAPADRDQLKAHPDVTFTGFCDVDSNELDAVRKDFPDAFTCRDFREAFDRHAGKFDGVVVCTPDHNHALVMMTALKAGKHVYGQKPLVQQLSEVKAMLDAVKACPQLVTQTGNQRMGYEGRQRAVDILKRGLLGKAIEAHVWVNGPNEGVDYFFWYGGLKDPITPPENVDWTLWQGAAQDAPCRPGLIGRQWRSSWDYGTGQLGDWCTHLLDVLYFAYDLPAPASVLSQTMKASDFYHALCVHSTLTYPVAGPLFAKPWFPVHYCDRGQAPSRAALGIPAGTFPNTGTLVVCEDGILLVEPEGKIEVWRGGKPVDPKTIPGQGEVKERNHWHSWVDRIVGKKDAFVQTPFEYGARLAEAGVLCSRAARFPNVELLWDRETCAFTNHEEATKTVVRREYRKGFELPTFA
jgi:predicted dehydrogenase